MKENRLAQLLGHVESVFMIKNRLTLLLTAEGEGFRNDYAWLWGGGCLAIFININFKALLAILRPLMKENRLAQLLGLFGSFNGQISPDFASDSFHQAPDEPMLAGALLPWTTNSPISEVGVTKNERDAYITSQRATLLCHNIYTRITVRWFAF